MQVEIFEEIMRLLYGVEFVEVEICKSLEK